VRGQGLIDDRGCPTDRRLARQARDHEHARARGREVDRRAAFGRGDAEPCVVDHDRVVRRALDERRGKRAARLCAERHGVIGREAVLVERERVRARVHGRDVATWIRHGPPWEAVRVQVSGLAIGAHAPSDQAVISTRTTPCGKHAAAAAAPLYAILTLPVIFACSESLSNRISSGDPSRCTIHGYSPGRGLANA
jgi:hypothetical protein